MKTRSQMHHTDKYLQQSSFIWPVWLNGWVFVYKLNGFAFKSRCYEFFSFSRHPRRITIVANFSVMKYIVIKNVKDSAGKNGRLGTLITCWIWSGFGGELWKMVFLWGGVWYSL